MPSLSGVSGRDGEGEGRGRLGMSVLGVRGVVGHGGAASSPKVLLSGSNMGSRVSCVRGRSLARWRAAAKQTRPQEMAVASRGVHPSCRSSGRQSRGRHRCALSLTAAKINAESGDLEQLCTSTGVFSTTGIIFNLPASPSLNISGCK